MLNTYAEVRSQEWVRGNYALGGVAILAIVVLGLTVLCYRLQGFVQELKRPVFVFVDELGQAHPKDYRGVEFRADDPRFESVIKGALATFCRDLYERKRSRIAVDFPQALLFMSRERAQPLKDQIRDGVIDEFLNNQSQPEVSFELRNVSLGSVSGCGYQGQKACTDSAVDFSEVSDGKRKFCTAHIDFRFAKPDEDYINSIGLAATDWHKDCGTIAQN